MLDILRAGNKALETPVEELIVIHTQKQPAYVEMTSLVPIVKLVRLDKLKSFSLDDFNDLVCAEKRETTGPAPLSPPPPPTVKFFRIDTKLRYN